MSVPKILHSTVPEHPPAEWDEWWAQWCTLHPDWTYCTWQDPLDPADFPVLGHRFAEVHGAQLAGLVRLELLFHYGGVYLDADIEPTGHHTLDELCTHPCWIGTEDGTWLTDAAMGAEPMHPGIEACLDAAREVDLTLGPHITGPHLVTDALRGRDDVTVLSARSFYPYHYTAKADGNARPADQFLDSYGVHRWAFSWKDDG